MSAFSGPRIARLMQWLVCRPFDAPGLEVMNDWFYELAFASAIEGLIPLFNLAVTQEPCFNCSSRIPIVECCHSHVFPGRKTDPNYQPQVERTSHFTGLIEKNEIPPLPLVEI